MRLLCLLCLGVHGITAQAEVDFVKNIQPIFEAKCLKCHGAERPRAGLSMHTRAALIKGARAGEVIVLGKPDESILVERIGLPDGDELRMPPEGQGLTKDQQQLVAAWIREGAKWPKELVLKDPAEQGAPKTSKVVKGVPITAEEKDAVAKLQAANILVMRLAQNTNLLRVDFSLRPDLLNEGVLADLKAMANLSELDLGGTSVNDAMLVHLEPLGNLTRLHLEKTQVSDEGLVHLKKLSKLEWLNLYGTTVSDAGLPHLEALQQLKKLYLWQTKVTPEGAAKLNEAVPQLEINLGIRTRTEDKTSKPE